jgi:hypothetical protein
MNGGPPLLVNTLLILSITCLFSSCTKYDSQAIEASFVFDNYCNLNTEGSFVSKIDSVEFSFLHDKIEKNLEVEFESLSDFFEIDFLKVDQSQTNAKTKLYLKSLILADFVYGAFSGQLLGDEFGMPGDTIFKRDWLKLSMREQFELGNSNLVSFSCGMRTEFYKKLMKKVLELEVRDTSIQRIHTYAIVRILGNDFILDPSDPVVFFNDSFTEVLNLKQLRKRTTNIELARSTRVFGSSRLLISNTLYQRINKSEKDLKSNLIAYYAKKEAEIKAHFPNCFQPALRDKWIISPIENEYNKIAINFNERSLNSKLEVRFFRRDYFGDDCKNALLRLN